MIDIQFGKKGLNIKYGNTWSDYIRWNISNSIIESGHVYNFGYRSKFFRQVKSNYYLLPTQLSKAQTFDDMKNVLFPIHLKNQELSFLGNSRNENEQNKNEQNYTTIWKKFVAIRLALEDYMMTWNDRIIKKIAKRS